MWKKIWQNTIDVDKNITAIIDTVSNIILAWCILTFLDAYNTTALADESFMMSVVFTIAFGGLVNFAYTGVRCIILFVQMFNK
ncbi:hypothetical protein VP501E541_P0254 [Vibrio phage 501E54-1]|nr:hypothetical protein VP501E541_P0254 [Vibrio phage 501E54-1]